VTATESTAEAPPEPPPAPAAPEPPETVIESRSGWRLPDLAELWRFRELFFILAWRDVAVRYKQTALGVAWAVIQPLATMAVFSLVLARVGGVAESVEFYPLFALAGLLPWGLFSGAVTAAGNSLVGNQGLVTKVYFPRLIIPVSAAGAPVVDFAVGLVLLALFMPFVGAAPGWSAVLLPVVFLLLVTAAVGAGTLLAALTVAYRDFRYVIPFGIQLWMFATPIIYLPAEVLGPTTRAVLPLNPAYGLVLNFRNCVLGAPVDWYSLLVSGGVAVGLLVVGTLYFRRVERSFADVI
jgi:lipopolysaccharide transport system permease protein